MVLFFFGLFIFASRRRRARGGERAVAPRANSALPRAKAPASFPGSFP